MPALVAADVTVYPECDYQGRGVILPPGDYSARELRRLGVPDNSVSSVDVARGSAITLFENDGFAGRYGTLRRSDPCLSNDRFDDLVSSISVRETLDTSLELNTPARAANSATNGVTFFSECGFQGRSATLPAGEHNLSEFLGQGLPDNSISSIKVPSGYNITLYENDFLRGKAGRVKSSIECLSGGAFDNVVSSVEIKGAPGSNSADPQGSNSSGGTSYSSERGNTAVVLYAECNYQGKSVALEAGEYSTRRLGSFGLANNSISSIKVADGWQVELFENDLFRGTSGILRQNDDCLIDDRFNDQISSLIVSQSTELSGVPKAPTQSPQLTSSLAPVDAKDSAMTIYRYCNYKGNAVNLAPGRYNREALARQGLNMDAISSFKLADNYRVTLYTNNTHTGRGRTMEATEDCLDDDGLLGKVSSLVLEVREAEYNEGVVEVSPRPLNTNQRDVNQVDRALKCVEQYVNRNVCDSQRWADMQKRCQLESVELMNDGYLRGHIEAGNCKQELWGELSRRVANPRFR